MQPGLFNDAESCTDVEAEPALEDAAIKTRARGGKRKPEFEAMETIVAGRELAADGRHRGARHAREGALGARLAYPGRFAVPADDASLIS